MLSFARIGSKSGAPRRVLQGRRRPEQTLRVYAGGKRAWSPHRGGLGEAEAAPPSDFIGAAAGGVIGYALGAEISRRTERVGGIPIIGDIERGLALRLAGGGLGALGGVYAVRKI